MRRYRERAAEYEHLADACSVAEIRYRYRLVAHRYTELADMVERSDKARGTQRLETLREMREGNDAPDSAHRDRE